MGGVHYSYHVQDFGSVPALIRLAAYFDDLTPLMDELGAEIEDQTVERFQTNLAPDGTPWLPSERVNQAQGNALTLVDSAHLRDSVTRAAFPRSVQIGTNLIYGAIHQAGGETGRNHSTVLPARPYLGLSEDNGDDLIPIADDYYLRAFGGARP
ncbi:MAG: phage virion morphogenesis protein [Alphaproteobacteria bacterium]